VTGLQVLSWGGYSDVKRHEVSVTVRAHVVTFWTLKPCSLVRGPQHFGPPVSTFKMEQVPTGTSGLLSTQDFATVYHLFHEYRGLYPTGTSAFLSAQNVALFTFCPMSREALILLVQISSSVPTVTICPMSREALILLVQISSSVPTVTICPMSREALILPIPYGAPFLLPEDGYTCSLYEFMETAVLRGQKPNSHRGGFIWHWCSTNDAGGKLLCEFFGFAPLSSNPSDVCDSSEEIQRCSRWPLHFWPGKQTSQEMTETGAWISGRLENYVTENNEIQRHAVHRVLWVNLQWNTSEWDVCGL
jgi:hypothetical protein